ncbi:MAG: methyltransferase domain-containing protein [Bacteroidetes bacterium]|nr:methyltransferase domain-containing protein [Bacteroidota bacterium]
MDSEINYLEVNRQSWNNRTDTHIESEFYDVEGFKNGKTSLNPIELELLGDVSGKKILHLQCHFGQDSISLARMGASVVGVDLSDIAINRAKVLAQSENADVRFICCDIYHLKDNLDEKFDLVFTSYGTIGWLPDMNRWAEVISHFLKPQGKFVFVEFHPVVWMFNDSFDSVGYNYFNSGPIIEEENGTYADREADISQNFITWNHSISEVINALIRNNMNIRSLDEFDYSPYNCFRDTVESEPQKFRIKHLENMIPMVYSVVAVKMAN